MVSIDGVSSKYSIKHDINCVIGCYEVIIILWLSSIGNAVETSRPPPLIHCPGYI